MDSKNEKIGFNFIGKKMTLREKMLAVYQKRNQDKIPWAAYGFLLPRGKI